MAPGESEPSDTSDEPDPRERAARARRLRELAVKVDSQPGLLTAAERLRRSLPGDERLGDTLSTQGSQPLDLVARGVSAMQPDRKSLVQELGLAGLQVWQSLSEAAGRGRGDQEMAVLFTDLVGFSSWALKAGDEATIDLLRQVGDALEAAIGDHTGRIVKRLGDGVMATFLEPRPALDAALDAQEAIGRIDLDGHTPRMRAGIHWGRPRKLGGDYLGVDVNIAARVGAAAKADQVLVSETLLARIDTGDFELGRSKRLKAEGAPRSLQVVPICRP
jgi:adenylate cyclase